MPILPSTIDDIPPSSLLRRRPLTAEEIRDVRSLIGRGGDIDSFGASASTATTTTATATTTTTTTTRKEKPTPLSGRRVMVPLTSRAFFEGELRPPRRGSPSGASPSSNDDDDDDVMDEVVYVNVVDGGRLVEMTRAEAMMTTTLLLREDHRRDNSDDDDGKSSETTEKKNGEEGPARTTRGGGGWSRGFLETKKKTKKKKNTPTSPRVGADLRFKPDHDEKKPDSMKIGTPHPDNGTATPTRSEERERETTTQYEAASSDDSEERMFPLMEIRELCDDDGGIVSSEVVDMSSTMRRLGGLGDVVSADDGAEEEGGRRFGEILARTLRDAEVDIQKDAHHASSSCSHHITENGASSSGTTTVNDDDDAEADERPHPPSTTTAGPTGPTSDAAYGELRSRLEELERLEEEDDRSKMENRKSSVRLQSGGWSRGFLETKTKTKKTPPPPSSRRRGATEGHGGAEGGGSTRSVPSSNEGGGTTSDASKPDLPPATTTTKVSFSGVNEVREIPRIGRTRVPPRPTSAPGHSEFATALLPGVVADPPAVPFEGNVFRGVVKERNAAIVDGGGVVDAARQDGSGGGGGKKRLSRFAQQRLERESA